jgi:predicted RNase H-like HicB family nuclease
MAQYRYTVYFEPLQEGGYQVVFPAFPEIVTFGRTLREARAMALDALRCHLEGLHKGRLAIPVERRSPRGQPVKERLAIAI